MWNSVNRTSCALAILLVVAVGALVEAQSGKAGKTFTSGRLSVTIPQGWEQQPGELAFRTARGTERMRFIAVSEEPVPSGYTSQQLADMLEGTAMGLDGVKVISRSSTQIDGKRARVVEFRRTQAGKPVIRGKHLTVPLQDSVVTVFWYVRESDWRKGQEEMERIVKTIRIR